MPGYVIEGRKGFQQKNEINPIIKPNSKYKWIDKFFFEKRKIKNRVKKTKIIFNNEIENAMKKELKKQIEEIKNTGKIINFRNIIYEPSNELETIIVFILLVNDLNFQIEKLRTSFPDCIALRLVGEKYERTRIEFEYKCSGFKKHNHNSHECDIIVCWENDWKKCPIEVIELKELIKSYDNKNAEELIKINERIKRIEETLKLS